MTSGNLYCCPTGVKHPFNLRADIPDSSRFAERELSLISSQVQVGNSGVLSSCDEDLREPLLLPKGSQASFQVVRGTSGFLLSHCRGIGPHLELRQETWGTTAFATGFSGSILSFDRGIKPRLMMRHGAPLSSRVEKEMSGLLSS